MECAAALVDVVVLHDDGLRTSYSFLALVAVRRGDRVVQGQTVGTTQERFHFGVRAGEAYLDPAQLFGGGPPQVYLVPEAHRKPLSEAEERGGIVRMFGGLVSRVIDAGAEAVAWASDQATEAFLATVDDYVDKGRGALHYAIENRPTAHLSRFVEAAQAGSEARTTCMPATVPAPKLQERRILVRVAGLGSKSSRDSIDDLDAAALGYAPGDDVRFSYNGGTTKENEYVATDTTGDIRESGRRLRELLARIEAANPGVPIDIVAHSQGGIVARSALTDEGEPTDPRLPKVSSLVTLGSPHLGAPIATGLTMVGHTDIGDKALTATHLALPDHIDPAGTSINQLAEHSLFMARLNRRPLPAGIRATSIAAREDLIVPAGRTLLAGAHNVTVSVPGHLDDHSLLPSSAQTQREVALALAGMAPTCQSFGDAMADAAVSGLIYAGEAGLGGGAWIGAERIDQLIDKRVPDVTVPRRYDLDHKPR